MRLTIKDKEIRDNFNAEYAKLADLEDIEEELGIDLLILSKCKYVFIKKGKKIMKKSVLVNLRNNSVIYFQNPFFVIRLTFKNYGKTWALTKEELL